MRGKIILVLALVMGGITTYLFFGYMKKYDTATTANVSTDGVVTAKQPIKQNERITASMLQIVQAPRSGIHPDVVKSVAAAEGKIAAADITAGETLLGHRLKLEKDESLFVSRKVREGYRAVAVGVNLVQSVSNLIEPEDYVDVVSTSQDKSGSAPVVSVKLLERVRVLAVGRRMVEAKSDTPYAEFSSVTLEVKPEDEVALINADERGNISLVLQSRVNSGK